MNKTRLYRLLTGRYPIALAAALLLYAAAGFLLLPWLIRTTLPDLARTRLHCGAQVDRVRINPFFLSFEAAGFRLAHEDGAPLAAFDRLFVDLQLSSLFQGAVVLGEFTLERPELHLVIEPDGSLNVDRLRPPAADQAKPPAAAGDLFPLIIQRTALTGGTVNLTDRRQTTPAASTLKGINLRGQVWATVQDRSGDFQLELQTEDDAVLKARGSLSLAPLHSEGRVELQGLRAASLWQFFRDRTNLKEVQGRIALATDYRLSGATSPPQAALTGLTLAVTDLACTLAKADKPFLQWKQLELEVPNCDLAAREVQLRRLVLTEGAMAVRIDESGKIDLAQILRQSPSPAGAQQPAEAVPPFRLHAETVELRNLAATLDDRSRKIPLTAAVGGLDLRLQAELAAGDKELTLVVGEIGAELRGARVLSSPAKEPLFAAERLTAAGGRCDLAARSITFDHIGLSKGEMHGGLTAQGQLNWQLLLEANRPGPAASGPAWKYLVKKATIDNFRSRFFDLTTGADKPVVALQGLSAQATQLDGTSPVPFTLAFQSERGGTAAIKGTLRPAEPALEAELNLAGIDLTSLQPYLDQVTTLTLQSAAVSAQGRLRYALPGDPARAAYEGGVSLDRLRLVEPGKQQPYLSWEAVRMPKGRLTLAPNRLDAETISLLKPAGELIINEDKTLNLVRVLKKRPESPKPAAPDPGPGRTEAKKPGAKKPAAKPSAAKKPAAPPPPAAKAGPEPDDFAYRINKVQLDNGDLVFADLSLKPQFMTRIHSLKGTVTGLSSEPTSRASVQLDGQIDEYGLAKISGVIRPVDFGQASDINLVFRNVAMQKLSPYSGKFAGRLIRSGKVSADLKYKLAEYKMIGDNRIIIDNLVLGEQVDSPESANLPLDLAIALLKDSSGRIDIGLPVSGDLNDPQFSIGSLIWKMLTNLITKTVSSPFRALGGLFGGDAAAFEALAFASGSAALQPPEKEKLGKLADALQDRPQLKLVLQGRYNPAADGQALKEQAVRARVAARLDRTAKADEPLEFGESGTQKGLEILFAEQFGKEALKQLAEDIDSGKVVPRKPEGLEGPAAGEAGLFTRMSDSLKLYALIPGGRSSEQAASLAGELYLRLVESEPVADQALKQLAENRVRAATAEIESQGRIPANRLGTRPPEPLESGPPAVSLTLDAL